MEKPNPNVEIAERQLVRSILLDRVANGDARRIRSEVRALRARLISRVAVARSIGEDVKRAVRGDVVSTFGRIGSDLSLFGWRLAAVEEIWDFPFFFLESCLRFMDGLP